MTSKQLFYVLCGILALLAGLSVAGTVLGNAFLEQQTRKIIELKVEGQALDDQQKSLNQAKKDIKKYEELGQIAKSIVPQEKDQARTVREIVKLAEETSIPIANISFPASNLGQAKATKAGAAGSQTSTTQVTPVEGIAGVYQLPISVQTATSNPVLYQDMLEFLSRLQQNRRTAHITNLTVAPSSEDRNRVTFNLSINAYIKP